VDKGNCNLISTTIGDSTFIVFKTTRALMSREGLTVASSWKKGLVKRPGSWQQLKYYIWNNKGVFFLPIAALFSALFGFICWLLYGRDPKRGTVYPLFEPPAGYSPAAMGYIYDQDFSRKLTAATIVDAAVRNKIRIDVEREGKIFKHNEYIIRKTDKGDKSGKKISITYGDFESDVKDLVGTTIEKGKYNSALGDLNTKVKEYCESNYKEESKKKRKGFFRLNSSYMILPGIVCFLLGLWALIDGVFRAMYLRNFWHIGYFILGIIFCSIVFKIFSKLLPLYTTEGRKMMDTIEGFRIFLSAADEKRFDTMNPPKRSLELYEKYLPFAIALGCEIEWGNRFEDIIETAYLSGGTASSSFSHSMSRDSNSFGSSFSSSFSGAISSASSPPSSSSGGGSSFGGGSSGGGGGGGGGGGW
ncbi:MAG TPA: DUF2207 domain-containing protein, partial [Chitinophagaceae bacterium]|jgi:uncharacterized membrane protein|nr:DUF2207 domain-containing protein [Chitinophagaceae bacterium]